MRWRRWVRRVYEYLLLRVSQKRRDQKFEDALLVQEWVTALASGDRDEANRIARRSWGRDEFPVPIPGIAAPLPEPLFATKEI